MGEHKVTIVVTGPPTDSNVNVAMEFDPPVRTKDETGNCLEEVACRLLRALTPTTDAEVEGE